MCVCVHSHHLLYRLMYRLMPKLICCIEVIYFIVMYLDK